LSEAINRLSEELQKTGLWNNETLRKTVLSSALPKLLLDKIGLDLIMERVGLGSMAENYYLTGLQVPDNYLRSIFGSYLASRFVYEFGSSPSQFAFFDL
jgi:glutamate dehydrogenase